MKKIIGFLLIIIGFTSGKTYAAAAAASAVVAEDTCPDSASKKIVGSFTTPDGHYTRFLGLPDGRLTSHLYRGKVIYPIPAVPMLHPYTDFIHPWIGLAARALTAGVPLPKFITDLPGTLADHFYIVLQDTPKPEAVAPRIIRLNYLLHTHDDEKTDGIDLAVGEPTGIDKIAITDGAPVEGVYKRVSSHTHPGDGVVIASPNIGKLDFGKPASDIESAAFWMVHRMNGVKTPTLFIIINDIKKNNLYRAALGAAPDMETLMTGLSVEGLIDDPATLVLKKTLGYA